MKKIWREDELITHWQIWPHEMEFIENKHDKARLGFILLLKFFLLNGRFPDEQSDFPENVIKFVAQQVGAEAADIAHYHWAGRTIERHRAEIREWCGFREITADDKECLKKWLLEELVPQGHKSEYLMEEMLKRCKDLKIEPPSVERSIRLVNSALQAYETEFTKKIFALISADTRKRMDSLLEASTNESQDISPWQQLKSDPGKAGIENVKEASARLQKVKSLEIPGHLFNGYAPKLVEIYAKRAGSEEPHELRRHTDELRATLLSSYLLRRQQDLTDSLVDLFVETTHKMGKRAEKRVEESLATNLQKVPGKIGVLIRMAEASIDAPDGVVKDVIYPIASEKLLRALVNEIKSTGPSYRENIRLKLHTSYRSHYRRMLPYLFECLEFRCTNPKQQPIMIAIDLIRKHIDHKGSTYPNGIDVPLDGVVRPVWMPLVVEQESHKINRTAYEICVLKTLREKLRCREIWVAGSRRYRDPEEDLPQDFDVKREEYYRDLGVPLNAKEFTNTLRQEVNDALQALNDGLPSNSKVKILPKKGGWISVSPFEPKTEPENLGVLKREIQRRWASTNLLDILKEAAFRTRFSELFRSPTGQERLNPEILRRRILLCIYGLGTNTGLKSMVSDLTADYKELQYVRRRFLFADGMRQAIASIANATLAVRIPRIWGEATTSCASDSKQFGSWDQNLLTEWHMRYNGRGVMVYWHVEKKSVCVYSQFKRVSSSEAAAMIEGVLRHCTEMEIDKQYVDSHGQNEIAFAFCRLLGFELMPRLKGIHRQKLYRPENGMTYKNLEPVMAARSIDWELIEQQLDALVKHAVALKMGMADAESLLRRFTRTNAIHPAYKALAELGKAIKTIFLCRYLGSEELRQEINEGLNVVESWNAANGFIFYGRAGEISTNRKDDQEMSLLCLHLLQASLVYINTLMIQDVLRDKAWREKMTSRDLSALSPLLTQHVNPYGRFDLDMTSRLAIETSFETCA